MPWVAVESAIGRCTLLPTSAHSQQVVEQPVIVCSDFGQESNEGGLGRERERERE